jgi:hypothetical protein
MLIVLQLITKLSAFYIFWNVVVLFIQPSTRLYLEPDQSNRHTAHSFKIHYNSFPLRLLVAVNPERKTSGFTATTFYKCISQVSFMSFPSAIYKYMSIILYFSNNYQNIYVILCNLTGASLSKQQGTKQPEIEGHSTRWNVSSYTPSWRVTNRGIIFILTSPLHT